MEMVGVIKSRVRNLTPLKIHRVEERMHVKFVEARSPLVGVVPVQAPSSSHDYNSKSPIANSLRIAL
ncbi:hypothetical protein TNCV_3786171 [Trichonephila clavipes]|nr:hypothetical protein TNCV_3786171 [Trichonephila clavipes]